MRWVLVVLCVVACKQESSPTPQPAPVDPQVVLRADAAAVTTDAAPAAIDLTRAVPMTITVSSKVRNKKILPKHIADRDLKTAWNSVTGELVGAWITVKLDAPAAIDEIRMTAGFTGTGPKGEDYFTMNPRIRRVALFADGKPAGTASLDVTRRELQSVPVKATSLVRVEIVELEPGTKKKWREVSVSELEVWGAPPAGWKVPAAPLVPKVVVDTSNEEEACKGIEARREQFNKTHDFSHMTGPGADDHDYPPDCHILALPSTDGLDEPWSRASGECEIGDEIYGPKTCTLLFKHRGEQAEIIVEHEAARADIEVAAMQQVDVIAGGAPELVVRWKILDGEGVAVCRTSPLSCTKLFELGGYDWKARDRFDKGELVIEQVSGTPPKGAVGRHPLVFK